jgi:hypothetical protein
MSAFNHTLQKRKSPCCLAAHTGDISVKKLKSIYAIGRGLQAELEVHQ